MLLPLLGAIALVFTAFFVAEERRAYTRELSEMIQERQDTMRVVAELIYACIEAESAERGYLLTGERKYADPYDAGRATAFELAADLIQRYSKHDLQELPTLGTVQNRIKAKFTEMDETLRIMREGRPREALAAEKTDVGLYQMRSIRADLEALRTRERLRIYQSLAEWNTEIRRNSLINLATTAFTLVLLVLVGLLATREIRWRQTVNNDLDALVKERTAALQELSAHLVRVGELEKASLARELHDELGGLLVAMRMDLAQLRRHIVLPDEDARARWARVEAALTAGVELKRRVIEELRPTLLDNLGLVAALRWQAGQSAGQGRLELELDLPEEEQPMDSEVAIALFRSVQEALLNTLKHARATRLKLSMRREGRGLRVTVEDDGIGLPADGALKPGSHGVKHMSFRMHAVGGTLLMEAAAPRGTRVILDLPGEEPKGQSQQ